MQVISNPEFCADYVIDLWVSFFKAKTWEELDMLAQKDPYIEKTVTCVKKLTEDEKLRMIAEAHQDQIMQFNDFNDYYKLDCNRVSQSLCKPPS